MYHIAPIDLKPNGRPFGLDLLTIYQMENGKYNLILGWFNNKISKKSLCL